MGGLPIFLGGCHELLVLIGPTYLKRLWCIFELFTFVYTAKEAENITVLPVVRQSRGSDRQRMGTTESTYSDTTKIRNNCERFDGTQCDCSDPEDKLRLLEIIRAAFGDMPRFNQAVRRLLIK